MKRYLNKNLDFTHPKLRPLKASELKPGRVYYDLLHERNDMVSRIPTYEEAKVFCKRIRSESMVLANAPKDLEDHIKEVIEESKTPRSFHTGGEIKDYQLCEHPDIMYDLEEGCGITLALGKDASEIDRVINQRINRNDNKEG